MSTTAAVADGNGPPSRPWRYIIIDTGGQLGLCRKLGSVLEKAKATLNFCGIPIDTSDRDFRLPEWRELDPALHMDVVREIFYWRNTVWIPGGVKAYEARQARAREPVPEWIEHIWKLGEKDVKRLIADKKIKLWTSRIDMNFDGKAETVYRMTDTALVGGGTRNPPEAYTASYGCVPARLPGVAGKFVFYVRPGDSWPTHFRLRPGGLHSGMRLFYWRVRIYWLRGTAVIEPEPTPQYEPGDFRPKQICTFGLRLYR